jgi:hypothetical protein
VPQSAIEGRFVILPKLDGEISLLWKKLIKGKDDCICKIAGPSR